MFTLHFFGGEEDAAQQSTLPSVVIDCFFAHLTEPFWTWKNCKVISFTLVCEK